MGKAVIVRSRELAALIAFDGKVQVSESGCDLFLDSENELLNTKYDLLLKTVRFFGGEKRKNPEENRRKFMRQ